MIVKDLGIISKVNVVILLGYMYVFNFLTCILTHKGAKIAKNCTQYFFYFFAIISNCIQDIDVSITFELYMLK